MKDELRIQFRMETFKIQPRPHGAEQVDVTLKFRAKQKVDGFIDKLKARMCLRGDQQRERGPILTHGLPLQTAEVPTCSLQVLLTRNAVFSNLTSKVHSYSHTSRMRPTPDYLLSGQNECQSLRNTLELTSLWSRYFT